ncbi:MAG: hypothetical protein IJC18_05185, partial [Clostridia bacterium]|nr:hypothetical protein [Clostridia bacterium]
MASNASFCSGAKKQVSSIEYSPEQQCCLAAESYALLLFSRLLTREESVFKTEHLSVARRIAQLTAALCGVFVEITEPTRYGGLLLYSVTIPEQSQRD